MKDVEHLAAVVVANIHMAHIERVATEVLTAWANEKPSNDIYFKMPTKRAVDVAKAALEGAFLDGQHDALLQLNDAMDAVTITGKKAVPVKALMEIAERLRGKPA